MNKMKNFIYNLTHRIVKRKVTTNNLDVKERWCPQWWFIWWHYRWREIGYQFMIPISYEDKEDAEFMENPHISGNDKADYWYKRVKQKVKYDCMTSDFE